MDRAVSPIPGIAHHYGRPTRRSAASYRLFPIVEQTPPASPVAQNNRKPRLHKEAGGACRRRSSSLENSKKAPKETTIGATGITATKKPPVSPFRDVSKSSLPEIHPLSAVEELETRTLELSSPSRFIEKNRAQYQDRTVSNLSWATPGVSTLGQRSSNARYTACAVPQMSSSPCTKGAHVVHPKRVDSLSPSSLPQGPRIRRSKPNLRVAIDLEIESEKPPAPPAKSPRHLYGEPKITGGFHITNARPSIDPPRRPDQNQPSAAHQQSSMSVGSEKKVCELTVNPTSRGLLSQPALPNMHIFPGHTHHEQSRSPLSPSSRYSAVHPEITSARSPRRLPDATKNRPIIPSPLEARNGSCPLASPTAHALRPYKSSENLRHPERPTNSAQESKSTATRAHSHGMSAPPTDSLLRAATPSSLTRSTADDSDSIASVIRKHTSGHNTSTDEPVDQKGQPQQISAASKTSEPFTRLAQARANVAALKDPETSSWIFDEGRASGFELGALNRAFTAEALTRRASSPGMEDPVQALKDLSSQVEALHVRYCNLRAERQRISAGLVERLKVQQPDSDFMNVLINDQLSLAAVSSSMDICFAKLKSLECLKEDAISELIAQASQPKILPSGNIASMVVPRAAVSRKASLQASIESESHYAATGRSTPDLGGESLSTKRSTQSSLSRTLSYTSDLNNNKYRLSELSRKSSFHLDIARLSETLQAQMPELIQEVAESPKQIASRKENDAPVTPRHELSSLRQIVTHGEDSGTGRRINDGPDDFSSSEDSSVEGELPVIAKRLRKKDELKSAKALGVPDKVAAGKSISWQNGTDQQPTRGERKQQEERKATDTHSLLPDRAGKPSPLFSKATNGSSEVLDSPAIQDLEAELKNFPKPSKPTLDTARPLPALPTAATGPLSMNPPTPAEPPPNWEEAKRFRHDSATLSQMPFVIRMPAVDKDATPKRTMTAASTRTTLTIDVYFERPTHEDFMEFY